jgi:peptidyl-prolyl cis-trans isomerase C
LLIEAARKDGLGDDVDIRRQVRELEERLLAQAYLAREEAKVQVTEADLRAWFEAHKEELQQPAEVRVARIFIEDAEATAKGPSATARRRADALLARAQTEPFEQVAHDGDGPEKIRGGDLGFLPKTDPNRGLVEAAYRLAKRGDMSGVVVVDRGLAIVKLLDQRPARTPSFEEARADVEARMLPGHKRNIFNNVLARLRKDANVQVLTAQK